jgi:hypothetical protein
MTDLVNIDIVHILRKALYHILLVSIITSGSRANHLVSVVLDGWITVGYHKNNAYILLSISRNLSQNINDPLKIDGVCRRYCDLKKHGKELSEQDGIQRFFRFHLGYVVPIVMFGTDIAQTNVGSNIKLSEDIGCANFHLEERR